MKLCDVSKDENLKFLISNPSSKMRKGEDVIASSPLLKGSEINRFCCFPVLLEILSYIEFCAFSVDGDDVYPSVRDGNGVCPGIKSNSSVFPVHSGD